MYTRTNPVRKDFFQLGCTPNLCQRNKIFNLHDSEAGEFVNVYLVHRKELAEIKSSIKQQFKKLLEYGIRWPRPDWYQCKSDNLIVTKKIEHTLVRKNFFFRRLKSNEIENILKKSSIEKNL